MGSVVVAHALCFITIVNSESPSPSLYARNKRKKKRDNEKKKKKKKGRPTAMPCCSCQKKALEDKRKETMRARRVSRKSEKGKRKEVGSV
jgi:hypothetical protein